MLRIEVDIMSGRPSPEWIITDQDTAQEQLRAVAEARAVAVKIGAGYAALRRPFSSQRGGTSSSEAAIEAARSA